MAAYPIVAHPYQRLVPMVAIFTGLLAGNALANDRDLQATVVPASSCVALPGQPDVWRETYGFMAVERGNVATFRCALPINNIEISSRTSNDNDISKVRVLYHDGDAFSGDYVDVKLYKAALLASGTIQKTLVCEWNSNIGGNGSTNYTRATFACPHDLTSGAFYHFQVTIRADSPAPSGTYSVGFGGIDFPK